MKTTSLAIFITALFLLPAASHAGTQAVSRETTATEPCYRDTEITLDMFGSYFTAETRFNGTNDDHGWGGGMGVNYFFHRYYGVGVEGSVFKVDSRTNGFANINLYLRHPIEGRICWAPYLIAGGGWECSHVVNNIHGHVGLGVDFRVTRKMSIFTDARYTWTGGPRLNNDFGNFRAGVSFVF